jgi:drug/metabolite transporter (DMT)-like permease
MFWIYVSPSKSMLTFQSSHQLSNLLSNIKEIIKTITLQKYHWGIPTHFLLIHFKSERPWFRKLLVLKAWSLRASIWTWLVLRTQMSCRYAIPMSLFYYGLHDTTASYATIFLNLVPLATFILSFVFRYNFSISIKKIHLLCW